jgi:NADPH:quinone reductase-like Zn-dependent oxidoreductase
VLVRVKAAALNRADISQRSGRYSQQATAKEGPRVAGLEAAGEVMAVGAEVTRFRPGDRVMSQCTGGYAELLTVDERLPLPVPRGMDWPEAAATPVAFITEHNALVTNARLTAGNTILIQAAGAVMGLAAVQIARFLRAGTVFGTVSDERQAELCRSLGLDMAVLHPHESMPAAVERHTGGRGVDVVIDHVGGPVLADNMRAMALGGRLVSVGRLGPVSGPIDLDQLALKRISVIGVTFRTRTLDQFGECVRQAAADLLPALADGRVRPIVDSVFPLEEAAAAQQRMTQNLHLGKIVLSVEGSGM